MFRKGLIDLFRKGRDIILLEVSFTPALPDNAIINEPDHYGRRFIALEELPEQRRRILEPAVFESCPCAQIAEKLGIFVKTVKTQTGRAYRFSRKNSIQRALTSCLFFSQNFR